MPKLDNVSRRHIIRLGGVAMAHSALAGRAFAIADRRPRVAAIYTVFRFRSHAYDILENFFRPYLFRGQRIDPGVDVVSLYADQFPADDMSRDVSRQLKVPLHDSVEAALCQGKDHLDVDAVLLIGEHGNYPYNELGQHMYPRKQLFDKIVAVMMRSNRFVPIYNDKHLSYRWDWAKEMYDTAKELKIPMLAGSSVPLAERRPALEIPAGSQIEEAVSIHGGGLESYDFHALEVLQSMVESRKGGETGVAKVELLTDDKLKQAEASKDWPHELIEAAMEAERKHDEPRRARPRVGVLAAAEEQVVNRKVTSAHAIRLTYHDGLRATALKVNSSSDRWNFACRLKGEAEPRACMFFNGPWGNRNLFKALSHAIQHLFVHGSAPYPIERTLLTTGLVDAAMRSHHQGGQAIDTPHLAIKYPGVDFSAFRENGASWKILTRDTPEPTAFVPGD